MNVRDARSRWIEFAELGAAGLLIVSFLLPWFQGRGADAGQSSSWAYLLLNSGWIRALESDLVTFGAVVALFGAIAGLLDLRRELARVLAAIAAAGFVASALGVVWTLTESGNAAFFWAGWGVDVDRGPGLLLFLGAALVGAILAVLGIVVPSNDASETLPAPTAAPYDEPPPPLVRAGDVAPTAVSGAGVAPGSAGRITVVESGRSFSLSVGEGERVIVGRDLGADIRVTDAKVSRRHAMIEWNAGSWIVRDLAATNPTRLLDASGGAQILAGQIRIASGQLVMGDVLLTLYPTGD